MAAADEAKAKGDAAFTADDFTGALGHFSDAIALSPAPDHILFSNRSATYSMRSQYTRALHDAELTVSLKPDWAKAYYRLGVAHAGLHNFDEAVSAYKKGLELDPNNSGLKSALFAAEKAVGVAAAEKLRGSLFSGPGIWTALEADWRSRDLLKQKDFVKKLKKIQRNIKLLDFSDERFACAAGVLVSSALRRAVFGDVEDQKELARRVTDEEGEDESEEKGKQQVPETTVTVSDPPLAQVSTDLSEKVNVAQ